MNLLPELVVQAARELVEHMDAERQRQAPTVMTWDAISV